MTNRLALFITVLFLAHSPATLLAQAQANSWTNTASGSWEDAYWSLGVLPGTNQTILFTNDGVKVLTIGPNTAENFPDTMNVGSITVSSPPQSGNILLLNYAGFQTPLAATNLTIGSNSIMLAYASSIQQVSDRGTLMIDGTFIQDAGTQVSAEWVYIDGTYNLISGDFTAGNVEAIDAFGKFIQSGGTNTTPLALNVSGFGTPDLGEAPEYDLNGGEYDGEILIRNNGVFNQSGGIVNDAKGNVLALGIDGINGHLIQSGGIFNGPTNSPLYIPAYDAEGFVVEIPADSSAVQTGGTNREYGLVVGLPLPAEIYTSLNKPPQYNNCQGVPDSSGTYTLSNGVLITSGTSITASGDIEQSGGEDIVNGVLSLQGALYYTFSVTAGYNYNWFVGCVKTATYSLIGGNLSANNLSVGLSANVFQSAGTNLITGSLTLSGAQNPLGTIYAGRYNLVGGLLIASNIYETGFGIGQLSQSGGQLIAGNISLDRMNFTQTGGTIIQSGVLALISGMRVAAGCQQFGHLQLGDTAGNPSSLALPAEACLIRFADSSGLTWSNQMLNINQWSGSLYGGGSQQIIFGSNSAALTPLQVSQMQFQNPAGLPPGTYPARILATGEIVPDTGAPLPLKIQISGALSNGAMPLQVQGDIGRNYEIEVSTDLMNWISWTNQSNSSGAICITDWSATNFPQRFYRVRLVP